MANVQNKHLAPGFCTYSGNAFLRLYRLTGKTFFVDILQLMTRGITQYLSHQDRPIEGLMTGWISERINTTDWLEGIGETMNGSTWAEISLMLVFLEIPGIYYNEQYSLIRCFDQCTAFLDGEFLIVRNTSQYDSFYRFFYDTSNLNKFPDPTSFQELFIRAGDEVKVKIENK
jgi:hypothetical protein